MAQERSSTEKLVEEARKRFKCASDFESDIRRDYVDDMRFLYVDQWPEQVKRERERQGRPCLTMNRLPAFVNQVISDARQNSPTIQIHPVDDQSDPEVAEIYEGLIRQIEYASKAEQAYDTALEHAAGGGVGAFRILTRYSDDTGFDQEIVIQRITNPMTVYWDPSAKEYDKSDAKFCFVSEMIDRDEFKQRWPKAEPAEWGEKGHGDTDQLWTEKDRIRVAEYWCKKPVTKKIALLANGQTVDYIDGALYPAQIIRVRNVQTHKVVRYLLAGDQVLEGPQEWAGKYIPIVPVFGPEVHIEGKVGYRSVHRYSQDAQRQYNYWQTTITERVALSPKAPYMVTPKQVEGFENFWRSANSDNQAYLIYNPDPQAPAPQRQMPPQASSGELQQAANSVEDIKATMGMFDASIGAEGNETSGRAILARQREGDAATFSWLDNLARSIQYAGQILVDLIPKIYDTARVVRVLGIDDKEDFVPINQVVRNPHTGEIATINDLALGKFDVTVSTGPSYQTQRLEAADSLIQFVQAVPQAGAVAMDLIAKNMDWPGADEFAKRLKKILPPGILDPDDPDAQEMSGPDPMQQAAMEMEMQEKALNLEKLSADIQGTQSRAAKDAADAEAQHIENQAVKSGLSDLIAELGNG